MKSKLLERVGREMKDESSVRGMIQFFVWCIIIAVVAFCEIMYVKIMLIGFPDGLVRGIAIGGAIATGLSVLMLYAAKNHWFSKGKQTWAAWAFTGVEIGILILNVVLAFNFDEPSLAFWKQAYPAAPIAALIGWGVILYLDRQNIMRRRQREMLEEQHEAELEYEDLVHRTRMTVKANSLEIVAGKLEAKLESAEAHTALEGIAEQIYRHILGEISGKHVTQLPAPRTVESVPQQPPALPQQHLDRDPYGHIRVPGQQFADFLRANPHVKQLSPQEQQNAFADAYGIPRDIKLIWRYPEGDPRPPVSPLPAPETPVQEDIERQIAQRLDEALDYERLRQGNRSPFAPAPSANPSQNGAKANNP